MLQRVSLRPLQKLQKLIGRPLTLPRSRAPYLKEQGWRQRLVDGEWELHGWYRSRYGSFYGVIKQLDSTKPRLLIKEPPDCLRFHSHWPCFSPRADMGNDWYSIHFSLMPKDLASAVLHIEGVLNESFVLAKKTA
jgi:hypothetical protein